MGVFNGDSIYNSGNGGGGGGYNDGGNLTPADYIQIENNSFYKLEGNDAADLNFVIDGESGVLNSIVEISTNVDSTVKVYVEKNGLLYALTSVDNLIYQNKNYRLYITGDSFNIDEIPNIDVTPSKALLNGNYINVTQINNYIITEDLGWYNYRNYISLYDQISQDGWEKLNYTVVNEAVNIYTINGIRSINGWDNYQGTNKSGLNFYPYGRSDSGTIYEAGTQNYTWGLAGGTSNFLSVQENNIGASTMATEYDDILLRCRFMKRM